MLLKYAILELSFKTYPPCIDWSSKICHLSFETLILKKFCLPDSVFALMWQTHSVNDVFRSVTSLIKLFLIVIESHVSCK